MAIKLIAIDMDGTLLNPQNEITPRVQAAIQKVSNIGVVVILATGRPFVGVQRYLKELGLQKDSQYCITHNGALIQKATDGECVSELLLNFNDYLYFEKLSRVLGVHFQALTKTEMFTSNQDISEYTVHEAWMTGIPLRYRRVSDMDCNLYFPKVMMLDPPELLDYAISRIPDSVLQKYSIMKSSPYYLEILDKRANKGTRIKLIAEQLGLTRHEVMAIGDQENDLAMLEYAGISIAMGNSISSVRKIAQFITNTNAEDGVALAIENFVLRS
ncbi:Sugar phosphatase YidA [Candidatus Erwinia haradaeae]|uniref:Sugar phosphatase YidA n=1 Tax=Candidatus Erwinia haradaeae TaxID=1922217 RepID=A0A451DC74_9GAMM|nr:sugar-phosphatase [Candidatus Erwinia haradaeae]VFP83973.1 Sugar phosphatase YidA [Candidatus Erwinia haradaeae]